MRVRVLFFGALGDRCGRERIVSLPDEGATVATVRDLAAADPEVLAALSAPTVRVAVDQRLASDGDIVRAGQEVAFFSPVSGG